LTKLQPAIQQLTFLAHSEHNVSKTVMGTSSNAFSATSSEYTLRLLYTHTQKNDSVGKTKLRHRNIKKIK